MQRPTGRLVAIHGVKNEVTTTSGSRIGNAGIHVQPSDGLDTAVKSSALNSDPAHGD